MDQVRVALHAVDPINHAGLLGLVESRPDLVPVRDGAADVLMVQAERLTDEVTAVLRTRTGTPVVLIGDETADATRPGVVAVLPRHAVTADLLARAARAAATGHGRLPVALLAHVERRRRDALTPREIEVLRLMADGHDTAEIADALCYSERTVKNVLYGITSRLNLRNRSHAVAYALRAGMI